MRNNQAIANEAKVFLADSYALYLKTQNFHWNVTGPQFHSLHEMFEQQYTELAEVVDEIAERIRTVGAKAPGSFSDFSKLTNLADAGIDLKATDMLKELVKDHETVISTAKKLATIAEEGNDNATADLANERIAAHEKHLWMLRSTLEG